MFENKIIDFYNSIGQYKKVKVVSCVKDIGITLVKEDDPNYYCLCLRMKLAPNFSNYSGAITHTRKIFTEIRIMIIDGKVDLRLLKSLKASGGVASASSCPFGQ